MNKKKILPPTFFNCAIVFILLLHFFFPLSDIVDFPWNMIGIVPAGFGIILNIYADRAFKKHKTTVKPFEVSSSLITNGMFRLSRNPMYLGMSLILFGICIFLGSVSPFLIVAIFVITVDYKFIRVEELMLEEQFGIDWINYKNSARRWI